MIRILDDKEKVKGIVAKLFCRENNPVSLYHNFYDPVYKDSCLEFFFSSKYCGKYVNCEMNSVGTSLIAVGDNRESRTPIDSFIKIPKIFSKKEFNGWSVTVFWSIDDLNAVLDDFSLGSGDCFYANFFKCGDETEYEHYCSWAPINAPTPNFHLPEFFGKMIIE